MKILKSSKRNINLLAIETDAGKPVELELEFQPYESYHPHILSKELPNGHMVVGYLSHDDDCQNPFEDCDGMGSIVWHPRHRRYGSKNPERYYEAVGLDGDGEPDLHHRAVEKTIDTEYDVWASKITDEHIRAAFAETVEDITDEDLTEFKSSLANIGYSDSWTIGDYFHRAAYESFKLDDEDIPGWREIEESIANHSDVEDTLPRLPNRQKIWESLKEADLIGNPLAVLLDCYEHSGISLSVSGGGMQCRWDTSPGAAVWIPDEYSEEYIRSQVTEDCTLQQAAAKAAAGSCKVYTSWANGDNYGVCIEVFDAKGERVSEDACWGFVGFDSAEESLKDYFGSEVEHQMAEGK